MKTAYKNLLYALIDAVLVLLAVLGGFKLTGGEFARLGSVEQYLLFLAPVVGISLFYALGLYEAVLRYLSFKAVFIVLRSVSLLSLVFALVVWLIPNSLPNTLPIMVWLILMVLIGGSRFLRSWQFAYYGDGYGANKDKKNVLIYGAGTAGVQLATLLSYGKQHVPRGFIDDSPSLQERKVEGYKVYSSDQIQRLIDKYDIDEIMLAIPSASRSRRKRILRTLEPFRVHIRSLPSLEEIVNCEVKIDDIREVDMVDLLGRDPVPPDADLIEAPIAGKVVMVTGAAGSIGSELCRQILKHQPKKLVMFEQHEFSLYALENEFERAQDKVVSILGSVLDVRRVARTIERYEVETIYHAAAYKHVPMVEHNPSMGVLNNIVGTYEVAKAACDGKVQNFVLISTDKAVRPTNIMGATKRVAELVIQAFDKECKNIQYSAVRFGNVIGSSGSVIPLFREQIRSGGPVTVTHPEITRFFMTVPEASQLVIQAGAIGRGGDIFVLDMGEPVKIDDMARHMIQLSGLTVADRENPDGDIEIVYQGLRSGEKLYEELLIDGDVSPTKHSRIMCANESSISLEVIEAYIDKLKVAVDKGDHDGIVRVLKEVVDGYEPKQAAEDLVH